MNKPSGNLISRSLMQAIVEAEDGNTDFRITIESVENADKWVQLSWDSINAAYPLAVDPKAALEALAISLPEYVEVSEWKPEVHVTFEHGAENVSELIEFIEKYVQSMLGVSTADEALQIVPES